MSTARRAVRQAMTVAVPVVTVAAALLGHPTAPAVAPGTTGVSRRRCSHACGRRCRSAVRARPVLI